MKLMVAPCVALVCGFAVAQAAEKIDLKRIAPVPANEPIPIADFFRPRILSEPTISPSGTRVASIITSGEDKRELFVHDLKSKKDEFASFRGDRDIYSAIWLTDDQIIYFLSARKMYGLGMIGARVGRLRKSYPIQQYFATRLIAVPPKDRLHPLVWNRSDIETTRDQGASILNTRDFGGYILNILDASASWNEILDSRDVSEKHVDKTYPIPGPGITYRYLADREGKLAYAFTSDGGDLSMLRLEDGKWLKCPIDLELYSVIGAGNNPGEIVVVDPKSDNKPCAVRFMDAATGTPGEVLLQDDAYDFTGGFYRAPDTREILGAEYERDGPRVVWFSPKYQQLQRLLDASFPGQVVRIVDSDDAQQIFLVACYSDRQPTIYNIVDLAHRSAGLFKSSTPWIDPTRMQPMNMLKFKTRDGFKLDAYLTLPAGASKENPPPLVVLPHGGPFLRDTWGFDPEVQFLASRGYAVLQPNYRGSTGYGWMFTEEQEWDFSAMHNDVTDATKAVVASGYVDPDRVAIMGGSFGGYLSIYGVTDDPDLYRCAVTIAGVFDWAAQMKQEKSERYYSPSYDRAIRKLGDPKAAPELFDRISPIHRINQIRVPVLVAGGKDDSVVEIEQSKTLISELQKSGVTYEAMLVGEEGHGMGHLDNRVELYRRIEAFLAKNLAKRATP